MKRNNKKGFTIVELVIVIAVIGILAAVLIPTFSSVIDQANDSARDQQAKNAYTNYLVDHASDAPATLTVEITDDGTKYYYNVSNNQIDLENAGTAPAADKCKLTGAGYVVYYSNTHETGTGNCQYCGEAKTPQS